MFGIGRLKAYIERVEGHVVDLVGERLADRQATRDEIDDLRSAISLFARKCDTCGKWKRKDAKGWMKRELRMAYPVPYNDLTYATGVSHICPDCMAAFEPVDKGRKLKKEA